MGKDRVNRNVMIVAFAVMQVGACQAFGGIILNSLPFAVVGAVFMSMCFAVILACGLRHWLDILEKNETKRT